MKVNDTLGHRIRLVLKERGMSQATLARLVGAKQQTIAYLVSEERPATTSRYTSQIAQALGVNLEWLADGVGDRYAPTVSMAGGSTVNRVPVLSVDQIKPFVDGKPCAPASFVFTDRVAEGVGFACVVTVDTMAPKILPGDCVIFDTQRDPRPGDLVIAICKDETVIARRYRERPDRFELVPENPDWETIAADNVERIVGVMVEHRTYRLRHSVA